MKKQHLSIAFIASVTTASFFCPDARADMAPWAEIHSLVQEGQDVKVKVASHGDSLNGRDMALERVQGDKTVVVGSGVIFSEENMISSAQWCEDYWDNSIEADVFCETYPDVCLSCSDAGDEICLGTDCDDCVIVENNTIYPETAPYEGNFCDTYPAYKMDCDHDGVSDCCLSCNVKFDYNYELVDECVPPGPTEYVLSGSMVMNSLEYGSEYQIDVVNVDMTCDLTSTDDGEDSDTAAFDSDETDTETQEKADSETIANVGTDTAQEEDTMTVDGDDTETADTSPEDSDSPAVVDTEDPLSTDNGEETEKVDSEADTIGDTEGDTETADEPQDTDGEDASPKESGGGCQVSETGAHAESALRQLMMFLSFSLQ